MQIGRIIFSALTSSIFAINLFAASAINTVQMNVYEAIQIPEPSEKIEADQVLKNHYPTINHPEKDSKQSKKTVEIIF